MSAHDLVVLVVHAGDQAVARDLGEAGVKRLRRNAREALRMGAEGRELEARGSRGDHFGDVGWAVVRAHRAVEREIHARLGACLPRLLLQAFAGRDQEAVVVRHVDDRGHPAGRRRARRPHEILLAPLGARMHLRINGAGQHVGLPEVVACARLRRRAVAHALDRTVPDGDVALLENAIGAHDAPGDDEIEIAHFLFPLLRTAEKRLEQFGIRARLRGRSGEGDRAGDEHADTVGHGECPAGILLHQHDGQAGLAHAIERLEAEVDHLGH